MVYLRLIVFVSVLLNSSFAQRPFPGQQVYKDTTYLQKFSVKYKIDRENTRLQKIIRDRNGNILVLSQDGLLKPSGGTLLYPGRLIAESAYKPLSHKKITDIADCQDQFVYLDREAVFSNAWAGKLFVRHSIADANIFCPAKDHSFLIAGGRQLQFIAQSGKTWKGNLGAAVKSILYDDVRKAFWVLTEENIAVFFINDQKLENKLTGQGLTSFSLSADHKRLIIGTHEGYFIADATTGRRIGEMNTKLPCPDISVIKTINGNYWFGTPQGAFMQRRDGKFDYYASERWLPSDTVIDIAKGNKNDILILTGNGIGKISFEPMTLQDKAAFFETQVRARHLRHGFNSTINHVLNGDPETGVLDDSDNDGLWTSMYLGAEVFRYAVTHAPDALQNCRESFDAMERLYTINPVKGFPARSFERKGYEVHDTEAWRNAEDTLWDWKSTTSSDEAIGHIFVFGVMAELIDDADLKARAIKLIDALMQHIVDHDMYLVDWDGKPTRWGRWNPEYVNARPVMVGDRKITASNIISMLQTAYHFTHKKIYKDKAFELMQKYGYLDNLMRPMKEIGYAPADADELSRELSSGWNHSDDEMYFLGYWGLYRYAFNDTLKKKFREAIIDHWEAERPEKEAAWNIVTAMTGIKNFDLNESVDYLCRYPLDLLTWKITNSQRKDIEFIPENFRRQTIREVLPPDESPVHRHNANLFQLDGGNDGKSELSAGDIWLLPYWMGRYLGVITAPVRPHSPI